MKKIFDILVILVLLSFANSSLSAGWSGNATVTGIYVLNENRVLIKLSSFSNPDNCQTNEQGDVVLNPTTQKAWFTVLLSAYMAKKTVDIYVTSNCTPIWGNTSYADIGHVRLL